MTCRNRFLQKRMHGWGLSIWERRGEDTEARQKGISQMIDELKRGDVYMKMQPSAGTSAS